ncbi:MAG: hypothetical protein AAF802_01680 [Planctomycetota bacterium]
MSLSRRSAAAAIGGTMACLTMQPNCVAREEASTELSAFEGIWKSHYRTTFIYLIIQPKQKAIFALLDQGYGFDEMLWTPAENGIIVLGYPMLRLWKTSRPDRCKVCMQEVPPHATNDTFVRFPLNFYMTRQKQVRLPLSIEQVKIPEEWLGMQPPEDFDRLVGKPREAKK